MNSLFTYCDNQTYSTQFLAVAVIDGTQTYVQQ